MLGKRWTEEQDRQLKALWVEGLSASQCGARLGISRNAVIGRVHRLDLPARAPRRLGARHATDGKRERPQRIRERKPPKPAPTLATVTLKPLPLLPVAEPDPNKPGLIDLKPGHCKFPHGDPGTEGFHFCGAKCERDASPYCDYHRSIAYQPYRPTGKPFVDFQAKQRRAA